MIKSKTQSGFEFEIDERALEDWGIIEITKKYDKANNLEKADIIPELTNMLLGENGFTNLEQHIRKNNDGFCTITALQKEIMEMLTSNSKTKNS